MKQPTERYKVILDNGDIVYTNTRPIKQQVVNGIWYDLSIYEWERGVAASATLRQQVAEVRLKYL